MYEGHAACRALTRRPRRERSGTTTTDYAYDGTMFVREFTGTGSVKATYLPGPRGVEYRRDDVARRNVDADAELRRVRCGAHFVRHRDDEAQVRGIARAPVG